MSTMSPEERRKRRERIANEALESVAKSEQFNFRMDSETMKRLYKVASELKKPVGALVREWVLERLNQEQKCPSTAELMGELQSTREQMLSCFKALSLSLMETGEVSGDNGLTTQPVPKKTTDELRVDCEVAVEVFAEYLAFCARELSAEQDADSPNTEKIEALEKQVRELKREKMMVGLENSDLIKKALYVYAPLLKSWHAV